MKRVSTVGLLALLCVVPAAAQVVIRPVGVSGQEAPGTGGATYGDLSALNGLISSINDAGLVAFVAPLTGPGVSPANNFAIFADQGGTVSLVARNDDPAPGTTSVFQGLAFPLAMADGRVHFAAATANTEQGDWRWSPGLLENTLLMGSPAPGIAGATFGPDPQAAYLPFFFPYTVQPNGDLLFNSFLVGPPVHERLGVYYGPPGALQLSYQAKQPSPSLPVGLTIAQPTMDEGDLAINDFGVQAFTADYDLGGRARTGLFIGPPNALAVVVSNGDPAPGTPGTFLSLFDYTPAINNAGLVVFRANANAHDGIWAYQDGQLSHVAYVGDAAPGLPAGSTFVSFFDPLLCGNGTAVFLSGVNVPGEGQMNVLYGWTASGGLQAMVVPGTTPPSAGTQVLPSNFPVNLAINNNGWYALVATVVPSGKNGLWLGNPLGLQALVALEGAPFTYGGTTKTVQQIKQMTPNGGQNGRPKGLNDRNEVSFTLKFTDGTSGVFVATLVNSSGGGSAPPESTASPAPTTAPPPAPVPTAAPAPPLPDSGLAALLAQCGLGWPLAALGVTAMWVGSRRRWRS